MSDEQLRVVDARDAGRYEMLLGDAVAGFATYTIDDDVVSVQHVETAPKHRGQGFAARLMAGILDDVRARELRIRPLCSYARSYVRDHSETHDLIAS